MDVRVVEVVVDVTVVVVEVVVLVVELDVLLVVVVGFGGLVGLVLHRPRPLPPRFDLAPRTA